MMYDKALEINSNCANTYTNKGKTWINVIQELHLKNKKNLMKQLKCMIEHFK